ncbi:hypothetical protein KIN20_029116 [Parelaphostrongylus tenuis]|uniref:Uncharacterized protein n=1 Tax=Parelaphostrongylus tenuis TaxID=148309 RepID=A0AAD5WF84_PARTN|nr:hypothetical protein KIN20_029116 [Parelaphostrongylus tenuis]
MHARIELCRNTSDETEAQTRALYDAIAPVLHGAEAHGSAVLTARHAMGPSLAGTQGLEKQDAGQRLDAFVPVRMSLAIKECVRISVSRLNRADTCVSFSLHVVVKGLYQVRHSSTSWCLHESASVAKRSDVHCSTNVVFGMLPGLD